MGRYVSWIANAALVVLCCFLLAQTINTVLAALLTPGPDAGAATAPPPSSVQRTWADREVILARNLFNASLLEPTKQVEPQEILEETKLPLELLGTAASPNPGLARAAVQDQETRALLVVAVGDAIKTSATVDRIERRRIILMENGSPRELSLKEDGGAPSPPSARSTPKPRRPTRSSARRPIRRPAPSIPNLPTGADSIGGAARLFSQARMLPKYEGGEMVGVQVNSIQENSVFEEIGVQEGDIITELNGIPINSPEASTEALMELMDKPEFIIQVQGANGVQTLSGSFPEE